ncbi:MAG: helix-turn-helix domain-containing protein [Candidatus Bathyarchaeia archaeon]
MANEELEGNTLAVYAFIAHANRPVGTRAVMRGANLSSPSVAHRHLQKLEDLGLIERNHYGDYVLKEKTSVNGYVWVGRNLVPRLLFYALFFMGAFGAEVAILVFGFFVSGLVPDVSFVYLTVMTAAAMAIFLFEGASLNRKVKHKNQENSI